MKKGVYFYVLCCLWNVLFHFVTGCVNSGLHDIMHGFLIAVLFVILLYAPLCTVLVCLYYKFNVNRNIIRFPLLFSVSPFLIVYCLKVDAICSDVFLIGCFILENIRIIGTYGYKHLKKVFDKT